MTSVTRVKYDAIKCSKDIIRVDLTVVLFYSILRSERVRESKTIAEAIGQLGCTDLDILFHYFVSKFSVVSRDVSDSISESFKLDSLTCINSKFKHDSKLIEYLIVELELDSLTYYHT